MCGRHFSENISLGVIYFRSTSAINYFPLHLESSLNQSILLYYARKGSSVAFHYWNFIHKIM